MIFGEVGIVGCDGNVGFDCYFFGEVLLVVVDVELGCVILIGY